jgi:addiction module HigA family antidote
MPVVLDNTDQGVILKPPHPGEILREDIFPALGISQGELADRLGVSRKTINEVMQEKRPLSPDMANRLGKFFGNGAGFWMRLQQQLDLWECLHPQDDYEDVEPWKEDVQHRHHELHPV